MPIPKPKSNESKSDFMVRCMDDEKMKKEYPTDQRLAICSSSFTELAEGQKISFDYDGVLSTSKGKELFNRLKENNTLYIITARHSADNVLHIVEGGKYEALTFKIVQMFNRSTTVHFSTNTPLLAICCYVPFFFTNLIKYELEKIPFKNLCC